MPPVYLSLGTNLGAREESLRAAVSLMAEEKAVRVGAVSSIYETVPVGYTTQPLFLNIAVAGEAALAPSALLAATKKIEVLLGRTPTFRWGPRLIDIDLLLYGDVQMETAELTLPHPRLTERGFVIIPLAEIAPGLILPGGVTAAGLAEKLSPAGGIRKIKAWGG
ncbi:MAG: 2-amino-4-hydroxy-6-hydroxymethyldihydropteridine diphosphokinase [bacterium]